MSIDNLQQNLHNRQFAIYNSEMSNYDPDAFADWLTDAFGDSRFKSYSALAATAKLSRSSVSALANAKKQPLTDKPSQPKAETVIQLANALNKDVDEALLRAGHAPLTKASDFDDKVRAAFQGAEKFSEEEKIRVLEAVKMFVAGVRAEKQTRGNQ